jgi:WD40 repeat protein
MLAAARLDLGGGTTRKQHSTVQALPKRLGDYELIREIARGGMGVVWLAIQRSIGRHVAIKLLPPDLAEDPLRLARFRAESGFAGRLQHPNIVAIHDVGEQDDIPYYSMDYVAGQDLGTYARERPLPYREAAQMVRTIALAVQYAHDLGVLHRDLKPSNVLVAPSGEPRITDFGLARQMGVEGQLTQTGEVLGSPCFMAPEQVAGRTRSIGVRTDIYGLGSLLYYAVTGRPPFHGGSISATLQQVLTAPPVRPREFQPSVPADLEEIILRCLAKETSHRFASARLLATELERVLRGQPTDTRAPGLLRRSWHWGRREPAMAILTLISMALVSVLLLGWVHFDRHRSQTRQQAQAQRLQTELNRYIADVNQAGRALAEGDTRVAINLLDGVNPATPGMDHRGFEWFLLRQQCTGTGGRVLWDGQDPILDAALSDDHRSILFVTANHLRMIPAAGGLLLAEHRLPGPARERSVVTVPGRQEVWIADDVGVYSVHPTSGHLRMLSRGQALDLAVDPAGARIAAVMGEEVSRSIVRIWELDERTEVASIPHPAGFGIEWGRDGILRGRTASGSIWQWSESGVIELRDPMRSLGSDWKAMAGSAGARRRATLDGTGMLRVEDCVRQRIEHEERLPASDGLRLFMDAEGERLVQSAANDSRLILRTAPNWSVSGVLVGHEDRVNQVRFLPSGQGVLTLSRDGSLRRWAWEGSDISQGWRDFSPARAAGEPVFSPDGRWLAISSQTRTEWSSQLWPTRDPQASPIRVPGRTVHLAPNAGRALQWFADGHLEVWELNENRPIASFRINPSPGGVPDQVATDGSFFACLGSDGRLRLYHGGTGQELPGPVASIRSFVISADGRWILFATAGGAGVYEVGCGEQFHIGTGTVTAMAFSLDGRFAVAGFESGSLTVQDLPQRSRPVEVAVQPGAMSALTFMPDGKTLVAGGRDGIVRFLNVPTWREVGRIPGSTPVKHLKAQPDRKALLVQTGTGARLLSVGAEGEPLVPLSCEGGFWEDPGRLAQRLKASLPRASLPNSALLR